MSKTYATLTGGRSTLTQRGHSDGVRVSAQSFDGSVVVSNWYDEDQLKVRVGTNDGSSCYTDWNSNDFIGTFEDFKKLLQLHHDIKDGKVSVVRHRKLKVMKQ